MRTGASARTDVPGDAPGQQFHGAATSESHRTADANITGSRGSVDLECASTGFALWTAGDGARILVDGSAAGRNVTARDRPYACEKGDRHRNN